MENVKGFGMAGKILDIKQVQEMLHLSERTVFRLIKSGDLKGFKAGREWRFEESDMENFIQEQREKATKSINEARSKKDTSAA
jgi:excisionase family DNA binding protein